MNLKKNDAHTAKSFSDDKIIELEGNVLFDEEENELIIEELCEYINSWERSSEDGWYYTDNDNDYEYEGFHLGNIDDDDNNDGYSGGGEEEVEDDDWLDD